MSDYRKLRGKIPIGGFTACFFADKDYGEVDPTFSIPFFDELEDQWTFTDYEDKTHVVTFQKDLINPLLTDGWSQLKEVFGLAKKQKFSVGYHGNNVFGLVHSGNRMRNTDYIPEYHSRSTKPGCTTRFLMRITTDILQKPYLPIFNEFEDFIRGGQFEYLHACCDNRTTTRLEVAQADEPFKMTAIGPNWLEFCALNDFKENDIVVFKFGPPSPCNVVHVFKW